MADDTDINETGPSEPGYYWLRDRWDDRWIIARFDGGAGCSWTFVGSLHMLDTAEVLGPENGDARTYELGARVQEPFS